MKLKKDQVKKAGNTNKIIVGGVLLLSIVLVLPMLNSITTDSDVKLGKTEKASSAEDSHKLTQLEQSDIKGKVATMPLFFEPQIASGNSPYTADSYMVSSPGYNATINQFGIGIRLQDSEQIRQVLDINSSLTNDEFNKKKLDQVINQNGDNVQITFADANKEVKLVPEKISNTKVNYLIGANQSEWQTNVATYKELKATNVYDGIDVVYRGNQSRVQYDFVLAPGADPSQIQIAFDGVDSVNATEDGDLRLQIGDKELVQHKPYIYQTVKSDGKNNLDEDTLVEISGGYIVNDSGLVSLELQDYNTQLALVIDPVLEVSTYLGNGYGDVLKGIKVDSENNVIFGGTKFWDLAILPGAPGNTAPTEMGTVNSAYDMYIVKLNQDLTEVEFVTVIGGRLFDFMTKIDVDGDNNIYFVGNTGSLDLPVQDPVVEPNRGTMYVGKISPDGSSLLFGTYLIGSNAWGMDVSDDGLVALTGASQYSQIFHTRNQLNYTMRSSGQAFVTILNTGEGANPNLNTPSFGFSNPEKVVFSSLIGGSKGDMGYGIHLLPDNEFVIAGITKSEGLASVNAINDSISSFGLDGFALRANYVDAEQVHYTYLDGVVPPRTSDILVSEQIIDGISEEVVYIAGGKYSEGADGWVSKDSGFPVLLKFKSDFSELISKTVLSTSKREQITEMALGKNNTVHVIGDSNISLKDGFPKIGQLEIAAGPSEHLHASGGVFDSSSLYSGAGAHIFYATVDQTGELTFATLYGNIYGNDKSIAIDSNKNGDVYLGGNTTAAYWSWAGFPMLNALQTENVSTGNVNDDIYSRYYPHLIGGAFMLKISSDEEEPAIVPED